MKKILFTLAMAFAVTNINAQLVVDSLGRVGIGTETPSSLLSIGGSGSEDDVMHCTVIGKSRGIYISGLTRNTTPIYGFYLNVGNMNGDCYGIRSMARGNNDMSSSQCAIGMSGLAYRANNSIGVLGGKCPGTSSYEKYAGVYGTDTGSSPIFRYGIYDFSDIYAGYFRGKVRVTNGIYATVLSPTASASPSDQNGTTTLEERGENVTDKLSRVQAVQFLRYNPAKETSAAKANFADIDIDSLTPEELDALEEDIDEEPEQYLSPIQYGLDADQFKAVYPELVYEDANGNVSINYVEMVPLLVQSINELSAKVAELEGTAPKKVKTKAATAAIEDNVSDIDMVRMDQNKPNPFSESTVITLNIPTEAQTTSIFIYDMSGKQVQSLPISERGETNITVYAGDLAAGMYIYTLVVDGKVSVTRRMIVEQ